MRKKYNEVINNLKSEIYNSIIEEFETYNKNEIDLYLFGDNDNEHENELFNEWTKLSLTNYFDGTICIATKIYQNDNNRLMILYEDEENKQTKIEFEIDIANHDHFSVDMYNALYNLLSDDDVKKANMNNND